MEALFQLLNWSLLETVLYQHLKVQESNSGGNFNLNRIQLKAQTFQLNVPLACRYSVTAQVKLESDYGENLKNYFSVQ